MKPPGNWLSPIAATASVWERHSALLLDTRMKHERNLRDVVKFREAYGGFPVLWDPATFREQFIMIAARFPDRVLFEVLSLATEAQLAALQPTDLAPLLSSEDAEVRQLAIRLVGQCKAEQPLPQALEYLGPSVDSQTHQFRRGGFTETISDYALRQYAPYFRRLENEAVTHPEAGRVRLPDLAPKEFAGWVRTIYPRDMIPAVLDAAPRSLLQGIVPEDWPDLLRMGYPAEVLSAYIRSRGGKPDPEELRFIRDSLQPFANSSRKNVPADVLTELLQALEGGKELPAQGWIVPLLSSKNPDVRLEAIRIVGRGTTK